MKQEKQEAQLDNLDKQIAAHSRAMGRPLDTDGAASVKRTQDGTPYTSAETAPPDPPRGALSHQGGGREVFSPLNPPQPTNTRGLTSTPRVDSGVSGVDNIAEGRR